MCTAHLRYGESGPPIQAPFAIMSDLTSLTVLADGDTWADIQRSDHMHAMESLADRHLQY